jgi:hypothetical protein
MAEAGMMACWPLSQSQSRGQKAAEQKMAQALRGLSTSA